MTSTTQRPTGLDPALFAPEAVAAETAGFNEQLRTLLSAAPAIHEQQPATIRAARDQGGGPFGEVVRLDQAQQRTVPGPDGEIPVRVLVPETVEAVYLHLHGGGWVLGSADAQDERLWQIATAANMATVSVDYRLAPEDPYPAGPDDCEAAAVWLVEQAQAEFGTDRIVIGGESAGGHLAAVTLLRMRDRHGYTGFRGANLVYGAFDLSKTPSQIAATESLVIPLATMDWFYDYFVPAERCREPDVSPLYADLSGMPPALFTVGTLDTLLDDSLFMHQRWLASGSPAELAVYPGEPHAFNAFPTAIAREANARIDEFIRGAIADES